jgi:hypothetical protein
MSATVRYAETDPMGVRQAFGATALFVAALGSGGYACAVLFLRLFARSR